MAAQLRRHQTDIFYRIHNLIYSFNIMLVIFNNLAGVKSVGGFYLNLLTLS